MMNTQQNVSYERVSQSDGLNNGSVSTSTTNDEKSTAIGTENEEGILRIGLGDDTDQVDSYGPPKPKRSYRSAPSQKLAPCGLARILGLLMTALVFGLISVSYFPMLHHYGDGSFGSNLLLVVFHVLLLFVIVSYLQTSYTDPGTVPQSWNAKVASLKNPPYNKCRKSGIYKPPRSHFCSVTRRVVLCMDHFCPWVNNCVGFFNRKFFIQFVFYTALACIVAAASLGHVLYSGTNARMTVPATHKAGDAMLQAKKRLFRHPPGSADASMAVMTLMGAIIDSVFSVTLLIFAGAHIWMASRNQTTIEGTNCSRPYRLSVMKNLESVFGVNKLYWFLPLYGDGPAGDGVHWQRCDGSWDGLAEEENAGPRVLYENPAPHVVVEQPKNPNLMDSALSLPGIELMAHNRPLPSASNMRKTD